MKLDPNGYYMMPAHFGPRRERSTPFYRDVTTILVAYATDAEALARYLPEPFAPEKEATISVYYCRYTNVDWLSGRSYNIIGVDASAVFNGEVDHLRGAFCLVMWENLVDPILTGRELQGMPKIYGEIPEHSVTDGAWRATASSFGSQLVEVTVKNVRPLSPSQLRVLEGRALAWNRMGWKYIPKTGAPGADVSHATFFPAEPTTYHEAWAGRGEVRWHALTPQQSPTQSHIANALRALLIREVRYALVIKGSTNMSAATRPTRALR